MGDCADYAPASGSLLGLRLGSVFGILGVSCLGVLIPLFTYRAERSTIYFFLRAFAGGTIPSLGLVLQQYQTVTSRFLRYHIELSNTTILAQVRCRILHTSLVPEAHTGRCLVQGWYFAQASSMCWATLRMCWRIRA